jgi:chorismate dehydratase
LGFIIFAKIEDLKQYRIGLVNYTNTLPYVWSITGSLQPTQTIFTFNDVALEIYMAHPAALVSKYEQGFLDVALLPVAAMHFLPNVVPITNFGIGADGEVDSVSIFSNNPIAQVDQIFLDPQSRTSNLLAKILCKEYWKQIVNFMPAYEGFQNAIGNRTAAVVIGDRAFDQKAKNSFEYDLAYYWKAHTNLPFVFARWLAKPHSAAVLEPILQQLFEANILNQQNYLAHIPQKNFDVHKYLTQSIKYNITKDMQEGLQLYLKKINSIIY